MRIRNLILVTIMTVLLSACGTMSGQKISKIHNQKTDQKEGGKSVIDTFYPQLTTQVSINDKVVEMETSMGTIKLKLFPEYAPKAVENFIKHSEDGYYNGLIFHRVIENFMIQGGDPNKNGTGGESIWGKPFEDEISNKLYNIRGALSMANSGPDTNGSQFFIVQNPKLDSSLKEQMEKAGYPQEIIDAYDKNGGTPWLDQKYTVFGQVIDGMDVVDKIAKVTTNPQDKPLKDVTIIKVNVLK